MLKDIQELAGYNLTHRLGMNLQPDGVKPVLLGVFFLALDFGGLFFLERESAELGARTLWLGVL